VIRVKVIATISYMEESLVMRRVLGILRGGAARYIRHRIIKKRKVVTYWCRG